MRGWIGRAIGLAAPLLLGGCLWGGPVFYTPSAKLSAPFAPGRYRITPVGGGKAEEGKFVRLPDGRFRFEGEGKGPQGASTLFVPLAVPKRQVWLTQVQLDDPQVKGAFYGLVERKGTTYGVDPLLKCEGSEKIVKAAGGNILGTAQSPGGVSCNFTGKAALEKALLAYANAHPVIGQQATLTRLGD